MPIFSGSCANNDICMYTSVPGYIIDCSESHVRYMYLHSCFISVHNMIGTCGIYVAFEGIFVITYIAITCEVDITDGCISAYVQKCWVYMHIYYNYSVTYLQCCSHSNSVTFVKYVYSGKEIDLICMHAYVHMYINAYMHRCPHA